MSLWLNSTEPRTTMYRIVWPEQTPVKLQEAKDKIGVGDDPYINEELEAIIRTAVQLVEDHTARALMPQSLQLDIDCFPEEIELRRIPIDVESVVVKYVTGGVETTWDAANYEVDAIGLPPRIRPVYGVSWPTHDETLRAVRVTFDAGYADRESVPPMAKRAVLEAVDFLYRGCPPSPAYMALIGTLGWGGYR